MLHSTMTGRMHYGPKVLRRCYRCGSFELQMLRCTCHGNLFIVCEDCHGCLASVGPFPHELLEGPPVER